MNPYSPPFKSTESEPKRMTREGAVRAMGWTMLAIGLFGPLVLESFFIWSSGVLAHLVGVGVLVLFCSLLLDE